MNHKTITFDVSERTLSCDDAGKWISFNDDYIAVFRFDSEWDGHIKTAEFIQGKEIYRRVIEDDKCEVPPLKSGLVRVGVYTSTMTSTPVIIGIKRSIKDFSGIPAEPPEDVYAQLTALIESGIIKGDDGLTPYVGSNNNWWIGDVDTGILARGYTPQKGVDYFTEEEVQQIQNEVSESIQANINHIEINKADKSELAKTNLSLDALWKMNRGQTYDVLEQESEAYSVDVPSGSKYAGIDKVGGHSEVVDGEIISSQTDRVDVRGRNLFDNTKITVGKYIADGGVVTNNNLLAMIDKIKCKGGDTFTISGLVKVPNVNWNISYWNGDTYKQRTLYGTLAQTFTIPDDCDGFIATIWNSDKSNIQIEKGSTATAYSPYSLQQIQTGFPVLNSAGSVYDYIDLNEGKLYTWTYIDGNEIKALTDPVITDIDIPTELSDWLTVEAGGSITFHNADDGKRLLIPNKLSFIRKLDEVTV